MVLFHDYYPLLLLALPATHARQAAFSLADEHWTPLHAIRTVAVVGAGPAGLQAAVALQENGLSVRLFERAPAPGGNWFFSEQLPAREKYPSNSGDPMDEEAETPRPTTVEYVDGDDGKTLEERWREHWAPRPVWKDMRINAPTAVTKLPDVNYPPGTPWEALVHDLQRHVRAYASLHGLNVLDAPNVTSYSTLVEGLNKVGDSWKLTLRRMQPFSGTVYASRLRVDVWEESFDAVVVAVGHFPKPYIPDIPGIHEWSRVRMADGRWPLYHAQSFRHPERYANKTVLIVGSSVSATGIAREIAPYVSRLCVSARRNPNREFYDLNIVLAWPENTEKLGELLEFMSFDTDALPETLVGGKIRVREWGGAGETILEGIDEVILATGYRRETFVPHLVDPVTFSNLHWTGHYIHDPTLAYAHAVRPWTHGRYQSLGFARVWRDPPTARLPSQRQMWEDYVQAKWQFGAPLDIFPQEAMVRKYLAWLNAEALELGGPMVEPLPTEAREVYAYYTSRRWRKDFIDHDDFVRFDELPQREWPKPGPPL
ncbi:Dimethylaniline monooxygenase [Mycena indigotica]|uniref:Dimethylaniline monooxygenase n=1 Tax=Mycena indigotica TaxID=2126181 RepID=A0A8H6W8S6_9AGAR|nr:Dimethylaniline monooxygenase [Mycena indigotica]KAF7303444.1 Dimethylaniline monooxygenase [Mycena indigotica]